MRKPRDYDSELKALADRAKLLKERQVRQLGELVIACRADAIDIDVLAGAAACCRIHDGHCDTGGLAQGRRSLLSHGEAKRRARPSKPGARRFGARRRRAIV